MKAEFVEDRLKEIGKRLDHIESYRDIVSGLFLDDTEIITLNKTKLYAKEYDYGPKAHYHIRVTGHIKGLDEDARFIDWLLIGYFKEFDEFDHIVMKYKRRIERIYANLNAYCRRCEEELSPVYPSDE